MSERPTIINEGTRIDLKTLIIVIGGVLAVSASITRSELAMVRMNADLRAEITRVENDGDKRIGTIETDIKAIKATQCAIARSLKVVTSECGRFEP